MPADKIDATALRDSILIASVRLYLMVWGAPAARWVADAIGLTEAQIDEAMDPTAIGKFGVEPGPDGARILVMPLDGMPHQGRAH